MSENKHTPEPWCISDHNKSIIKCYQGEQTPHGTTPYFAGGGALESERTANARRVVACVNRLAQFTTEQIEDFGYDLFAEDRPRLVEAQNEIHLLKKQRDELLAAFERFMDSHEECTDFDGFTAQIVSMADYHQAQEAIASVKEKK